LSVAKAVLTQKCNTLSCRDGGKRASGRTNGVASDVPRAPSYEFDLDVTADGQLVDPLLDGDDQSRELLASFSALRLLGGLLLRSLLFPLLFGLLDQALDLLLCNGNNKDTKRNGEPLAGDRLRLLSTQCVPCRGAGAPGGSSDRLRSS
jgi:hypothetical protein